MKTINNILLAAVVAAIPACVLAGTASATVVTVQNPDFSSPVTGGNTDGGSFAPGGDNAIVADWGITGNGGVAAYNTSTVSGGQGNQVGFVSINTATANPTIGSDLYQDVGTLQPNTTYSLTVSTRYPGVYESGAYGVLELVNGVTDTGAVLNSMTYTPTDTAWNWNFNDVNLSYTTGSTVQGDLTLVLGAGSSNAGDQLYFNNVRLTATAVPEPAAMGLFAIGGMGLLLVGRKRAARRSA